MELELEFDIEIPDFVIQQSRTPELFIEAVFEILLKLEEGKRKCTLTTML